MPRTLSNARLLAGLAAAALATGAMAQGGEPGPAAAALEAEQPPEALAGNWDLKIDGTTIFRFTIERTASGGWQGRWQRPDSFNSNGNAFANLRGGVKSTASMTALPTGQMVELAFDDPRPGAVPDIFRFRLIGSDAVAMAYVGTQLPPYLLVRAGPDDPLGDWDSAKVYRRAAPGAPTTTAPAPAAVAPAATAAPASGPPEAVQPSRDGRIILGPQVRFLDLTPRETAEEEEASEASGQPEAPEGAAPPAPASVPAPAATQPGIGEDFLEGL